MFAFRPLSEEDLALLHQWRNQPHVDQWWDGPKDEEGVRQHYAPYLATDYPVRLFIAELEGVAVGRIQYEATSSWLEGFSSETANIDFLIGVEAEIGKGLGPKMIRQFVDTVVLKDGRFREVVSDPNSANTRSIRALEKAEFTPLEVRRIDGTECQMMKYIPDR